MALRPSDASLKRLVARLAEEDGADVQAVLDRLDPAHRLRVHGLLKAYLGSSDPGRPMTRAARDTTVVEGQVSAWIAARLDGGPGVGVGRTWSMTPTARAALARARDALAPAPSAQVEPMPRTPSWLRRILHRNDAL